MTNLIVPVGSDAPRRQPAPGDLELVRQFVNTYDVEDDAESFSSPRDLSAWLAERGLLPAGRRLSDGDVATAIELRETLRELMEANAGHGSGTDARRRLDRMAAGIPLHLRLNGGVRLAAAGEGVTPAIGQLLGTIYDAMTVGTWQRLKVCGEDTCRWAFYDHSRNRSGAWCTMAVCGNRNKGRTFRRRHAESVGSAAG